MQIRRDFAHNKSENREVHSSKIKDSVTQGFYLLRNALFSSVKNSFLSREIPDLHDGNARVKLRRWRALKVAVFMREEMKIISGTDKKVETFLFFGHLRSQTFYNFLFRGFWGFFTPNFFFWNIVAIFCPPPCHAIFLRQNSAKFLCKIELQQDFFLFCEIDSLPGLFRIFLFRVACKHEGIEKPLIKRFSNRIRENYKLSSGVVLQTILFKHDSTSLEKFIFLSRLKSS